MIVVVHGFPDFSLIQWVWLPLLAPVYWEESHVQFWIMICERKGQALLSTHIFNCLCSMLRAFSSFCHSSWQHSRWWLRQKSGTLSNKDKKKTLCFSVLVFFNTYNTVFGDQPDGDPLVKERSPVSSLVSPMMRLILRCEDLFVDPHGWLAFFPGFSWTTCVCIMWESYPYFSVQGSSLIRMNLILRKCSQRICVFNKPSHGCYRFYEELCVSLVELN